MKQSVIVVLLLAFTWAMSLSEPRRLVEERIMPKGFKIERFEDLYEYLNFRIMDHYIYDYKIPGNDNPETFRGTFVFKIVFSYKEKRIRDVELIRMKSTPEQDDKLCESIKNMKLDPLDFQLKGDVDSVFYFNFHIKPQFY